MDLSDLLDLKGNDTFLPDLIFIVNILAKPQHKTTSDIPSIINLFQSEWDSLMLETYTLKKHL
jgi:pre-mRNA-processing factor 19